MSPSQSGGLGFLRLSLEVKSKTETNQTEERDCPLAAAMNILHHLFICLPTLSSISSTLIDHNHYSRDVITAFNRPRESYCKPSEPALQLEEMTFALMAQGKKKHLKYPNSVKSRKDREERSNEVH